MGRAEDIFERIKAQGITAIGEFLADRQVEELYLDFKRSADSGNGSRLNQIDRNNFAKAISGFGNSEGGILVWGVDASADVDGTDCARAQRPITNVRRFESWLQGAVSGCTLPPHPRVEHYAIDAGSENGFVVSLIQKSQLVPHQCVTDYKYYMRAGSSFSPIPHSLIMGMMGRRPQPWVFYNYVITAGRVVDLPPAGSGQVLPTGIRFELDLLLVNKGPGIARDLFANVKVTTPGENCQLWFKPSDDNWIRQRTLISQWQSIVSKDGFKLAPESLAYSTGVGLVLVPPFSQALWLELTCGCDGSPTNMIVLEKSAAEVQRLYEEHLASSRDGAAGNRFVQQVLGISALN
jgi:hypothetical protein